MTVAIDFSQRDKLKLDDFLLKSSAGWLADNQKRAFDFFCTLPLPHRKNEHWKYNQVDFLNSGDFILCHQAGQAEHKSQSINFENSIKLDFVNGILVNQFNDDEPALQLTRIDKLNSEQQALLQQQLAQQDKNIFAHLNQLIANNAYLLEVKANTIIDKPVYIRHISDPGLENSEANQLAVNALYVSVSANSQLTLIEQFNSNTNDSENTLLNLQQSFIQLAQNAHCKHYRLNLEGANSHQVSEVNINQMKDSHYKSFYLGLGSKLNRTDINLAYQQEHASADLSGVYLPSGNETIDYHTNIQHKNGHCQTNEIFRGIIADQAKATFNGKIHIFPQAQKSDAYLNNKNLLLTNQAEINTKPELEIYADDVSCAHGATVAQLDKKSLYYLQSRGIGLKKAKTMLSLGFINELITRIDNEVIREFLLSLVDKRMSHID